MISFSVTDIFGVFLSAVSVFGTALVALMLIYTQRRAKKYDEEKHRVELELMRRSIESQMYGLNEKLLATEGRWRDVNHLMISSQNRQPDVFDEVHQNTFLASAGLTPKDLSIEKDLVFVLTPFHPTHKRQFEAIASACTSVGLKAMRGDEQFVTGDIFPHILRLIARARIVIANIDGRNPNVFYELGIAHALGKPTILVAPTPEDVPFDLRTKQLVLFESYDALKEKLKEELARVVIGTEDIPKATAGRLAMFSRLPEEAVTILKEAFDDPDGIINHARSMDRTVVETNSKILIDSSIRREVVKWEYALEQLEQHGLIHRTSPASDLYQLTNAGYEMVEAVRPR